MNIGIDVENAVANYLTNIGYNIIVQRYKTKYGEIDLIARNDEQIVFIEVKYRKNINDCYEAISERQISRIRNAAELYISTNNFDTLPVRFDAIFCDKNLTIRHIQNAFWSSTKSGKNATLVKYLFIYACNCQRVFGIKYIDRLF